MVDPAPPAVLLVEDEEVVRLVSARLLAAAGWRVIEAGSAEEGLAAVGAEAPAVILLDLSLPGITGLEAIGRFQAASPAPIVIMTGHGDAELRKDALLLGAKDFLVKPVPPQGLDRALRSAAGLA